MWFEKVNARGKKSGRAFSLTKRGSAFSLTKRVPYLPYLEYFDSSHPERRMGLPRGRRAFSLTKERSYHVTLERRRTPQNRTLFEGKEKFSGNCGTFGKGTVNHCPRGAKAPGPKPEGRTYPDSEPLYFAARMPVETCLSEREMPSPVQYMFSLQ